MKKDSKLDDLLFKLLLAKYENLESLIILYGSETSVSQKLNEKGKKVKTTLETVKAINVSRTLETGVTSLETLKIDDVKQFRSIVSVLDPKEHHMELTALTLLLVGEIQTLTETAIELNSVTSTVKNILANPDHDDSNTEESSPEGNLILGGSVAPLAHIVFKTLSGIEDKLETIMQREDIERIGGVLRDIILNHGHDDLNNEDQLRRLKAEIEFRIIEALPNNLKAGDVNLDMNAILDEIKRQQGRTGPHEEL